MTALDACAVDPTSLENHRIQLEAVYWCFVGISTLFIALRFWAQVSNRILGVDDWLMAACGLSFIATGILLTLIAESGGTRHKAALTALELQYQIELQTINLVFWIATTLFGKMAIGLTILRIFDRTTKWRTWPVHVVIHLMNVTCVLDISLILFRCGNPGNLWDTTKQSTCLNGAMIYDFNIFAAAWQVFVDFFLAFFPMYIIWPLRMPKRRRYTVMTLLGLTTMTGVVASVKTAVSRTSLGEKALDSTWDIFVLSMWTGTEIMLLIVCGSVPIVFRLLKSPRQGYSSATGAISGGKYLHASWPKDSESAQRNQSVEDLETEIAGLSPVSDKSTHSGLQSPAVSHSRNSFRFSIVSKQAPLEDPSGRQSEESPV